jgi:hypothetical protein
VRAPTLADQLRQLSCIAEIRGVVDAADLRTAIPILDRLSPAETTRLETLLRDTQPDQLSDFPAAAVWRMREIASGRADAALRASRAGLPTFISRLLELETINEDQALALARELRVVTLADGLVQSVVRSEHRAPVSEIAW